MALAQIDKNLFYFILFYFFGEGDEFEFGDANENEVNEPPNVH